MIELKPINKNFSVYSHAFLHLVMVLICILAWIAFTKRIDLDMAWRGASPLDWVYHLFHPENFEKDFTTMWSKGYGKSAFMHIYSLGYKYFNILPDDLIYFVIGIEILISVIAMFMLTTTVFPGSTTVVPFLCAILSITGNALSLNLAYYQGLFIMGLYYTAANAFNILAIVMVLKNRLVPASILMALSICTHPALGIYGFLFILAILTVRQRLFSRKDIILSAVTFLLITFSWFLNVYDITTFSGGEIPDDMWFALTKLSNSHHWYSADYGLFGRDHEAVFLPFISFSLLLFYCITRIQPIRGMDKELISGMLCMSVLIVLGFLFSFIKISPFLIKLAFHRASSLIVVVGLIYVVNGLWEEIRTETLWRKLTATMILLSLLLYGGRPYPILFSLIITIPGGLYWKQNRYKDKGKVLSLISALIVFLLGFYALAGYTESWILSYSGYETITGIFHQYMEYFKHDSGKSLFILAVFAFAIFFVSKHKKYERLFPLMSLTLIIYLCVSWLNLKGRHGYFADRLASEYKSVQLWAKEKTKADALFMTDPAIEYGWRAYSQRSSFGCLREWLHSAWQYDENFQAYEEGLKRFYEFEIPLDPYLRMKTPLGYKRLVQDVRKHYYQAKREWFLNLSKRYGIHYFVFVNEMLTDPLSLPIAYRNLDFTVYAVPDRLRL